MLPALRTVLFNQMPFRDGRGLVGEMGVGMEKRKRWPIILMLWLVFILLVAGVAYLSFQNGEDAKLLGRQIIVKMFEARHPQQKATAQELDAFTYMVRQNGRALAFLLIGIIGTLTIHISCRKCNWFVKTIITACILVAIAYLTEKLKIYIPTRHYSYEEMLLSLAAVTVGFMLVSVITLTARALKGFFRLMATSNVL